ncbi:hypothetical protein DERP_001967 [Dermatophagoides pteronyssinus]|uniref:Uncharacterized protein n=2 Tax=Dermatophagoides pteronyssinus TaxID=6956 RepID=A0ABQ8JCJ0_DERPT|nr:uncharacterized protein LOC113790712 [Dermatophagoides pteronyssinus]KAH9420132.1 hypothetical protein DERP_001967 [Dermatophagoides pteronyssinus]
MRQYGESKVDSTLVLAISAIIIGLIFIISGAIVSGIAYTEITPPNYDDNYDRYIGSSVPRLLGPFLLVFGFLIVIGSGVMAGMKTMRENEKSYHGISGGPHPTMYSAADIEQDDSPPSLQEKM